MRFLKFLNEKYEVRHISGKSVLKTHIPPEERSLKNLPRDSNNKAKVRFQDWLELKDGWSPNGKCYGWSHRAIFGFYPGYEIKSDDYIGRDLNRKTPYKIKDNKDAEEHAKRFAKEIS